LEFDSVRVDGSESGREKAVVSEVKWKRLSDRERAQIENRLRADWRRSALGSRFSEVAFQVLDTTALEQLAE